MEKYKGIQGIGDPRETVVIFIFRTNLREIIIVVESISIILEKIKNGTVS